MTTLTDIKSFHIYLDLDGVMADFDQGVMDLMNIHPDDINPKSEMWTAIDAHMDLGEEFFGTLKLIHDARELFNFLLELDCELTILTATGHIRPTEVQEQKNRWINQNLSETIPRLFTRRGKDKAIHAKPHHILIDDRMKAVGPWCDAGGIGILHTSTKATLKQIEKLLK